VSDRDDALRQELGWTGPEEADYEPPTKAAPQPTPPAPVPPRPPVDFGPPMREEPAEPHRSVGSPHQPAQHHRPDAIGDTGPIAAIRHDWPPHAAPPPAPRPSPQPPGQPVHQGHPHAGRPWPQAGQVPPGPQSYADRIPVRELVPNRPTPPARGWRRVVYRLTFGLVNPGPSPDEIREAELEAGIRGVLRGHYKIGVMGKGGVGKTTVSASVGSVFAELRPDDRVVAIDADTAFGKLGARVDPRAVGSYWELAADQHLDTFADIRNRVGNNAAGLFVLAGESSPARRRILDPAIYREATSRLDRYFSISIVDCSSTMDSPVTQEVLRDLDALIVVSSPWVDGAAAAGQTMDWLASRGLTGLLQRTVVVLNDSDGHSDKRTRTILAQQFAGQGQTVVEVPFDGRIRPGGVISGTREMAPQTRRKFVEIAAALAAHFPRTDDRNRERY
jgi:MinD-like ATPase involved in chromosome partitioning or flagellar assembly